MNPIHTMLFALAIPTCIVGTVLPFALGKLPYAPAYGPFLNPKSRSQLSKYFGLVSIGVLVLAIWASTQNAFMTGKVSAMILALYFLLSMFHYPKLQAYFASDDALSKIRYYNNRKRHFTYYDVLAYATAYFYIMVTGPYMAYIAYLLIK